MTSCRPSRCPAKTDPDGVISIGEIHFQQPPSVEAVDVVGQLRCDGEHWQRFLIAKRQVLDVETRVCTWGVICYLPYTSRLTLRTIEDVLSSRLGVEHWIDVGSVDTIARHQ